MLAMSFLTADQAAPHNAGNAGRSLLRFQTGGISASRRKTCGASRRLATPRDALATRMWRTRYAQRPERDSTAGERQESNAMLRGHRADKQMRLRQSVHAKRTAIRKFVLRYRAR